jgi:hypothetical protein
MPDPYDRLRRDARDASAQGRTRRHTPRVETALTTPAPSDEPGHVALARGLYWAAVAVHESRGMDALTAGQKSLRMTRGAFATGEYGLGRGEVARALDVSDWTVRADLEKARSLARVAAEAPPNLPRIPRAADDRIVIPAPDLETVA